MVRTLQGQVTLASLVFGVALIIAAVLGFQSVLASTRASTHLAEHVLAESEATHRFQLGLTRAIGEAESYARGGETVDRDDAQAALDDARAALTRLDTLAATEAAAVDGADGDASSAAQIQEQRRALLERAEGYMRDLTSTDATTRAAAAEDMEALHEPFDQLIADAQDRDMRRSTDAIQAVTVSNRAATISLGLAFSLLAVLLGLAALLLRRRILRPLQTLEAATHTLATGHEAPAIAVTNMDEIGTLQRAFNATAATIATQTQELEQQVATAQAARAAAEAAHATIQAQLAEIEAQRTVIRDMSVPILPISATALVMPLVGALDSERLAQMQHQILSAIERQHVRHLLLDITGVPIVDTHVAHGIIQMVRAARLLGVEVVLVGVRPEVAQTIVGMGLTLGEVVTRSTLQSGLAYALQPSPPRSA
jgi:rsbT co-antagonist protein RsbR